MRILIFLALSSCASSGEQTNSDWGNPAKREISVEDWMVLGEYSIQQSHLLGAIESFESAIRIGELNSRGKLYVYWKLWQVSYRAGDIARTTDYLFRYIELSKHMLDMSERNPKSFLYFRNPDVINRINERIRRTECLLFNFWENRDADVFSRSCE